MKRPFQGLLAALIAVVLLSGCSFSLFKFHSTSNINTQRLDRAITGNPENVHAHFLMGRSLLQSSDPAGAITHFREAIRIKPDFEEAWNGIGVAQLDLKRPAAARKTYDEMTRKFPTSPVGFEGLATAQLALGNLKESRAAATAALERDANSFQAHRVLGEAAYADGNYNDAIAEWTRAAELDALQSKDLNAMINDLREYLTKYPQ